MILTCIKFSQSQTNKQFHTSRQFLGSDNYLSQCQSFDMKIDGINLQLCIKLYKNINKSIPLFLMEAIRMTDQQIRQYIDNIFEKYDKDNSFTLDLQKLSEFINDLLLAQGSISLANTQQIKNSMRALNPNGGDVMTKNKFYTSLKKFNDSGQDIPSAILETIDSHPTHNYMRMTNSQKSQPNPEVKISDYPPAATLAPFSQPDKINQIRQITRVPPRNDLLNTAKTSINQPVGQQVTPQPYGIPQTSKNHPQSQQQFFRHQQIKQQQHIATQNNIYKSAPTYGVGIQPSFGHQNIYGSNNHYSLGVQQAYGMSSYGGSSYNQANNYGGFVNSFGQGMGGYEMGSTSAPLPPFNPLAALSFF